MSRRMSLRFLIGLAAILSMSLGLEILLHFAMDAGIPADQLARETSQDAGSVPPAEARYAVNLDNWAATILDRPLFRVDRKPVPSATADAEGGDGTLPRLSGVIGFGVNRLAVFRPASGGHLLFQKEGSRIGQWTVESVASGRVLLRGPGGTRELHPQSDRGRLPGEAIDNPPPESAQSLLQTHPILPQPSVP